MDLPMSNEIDFAPTTSGGRVRLSTVVNVLPPHETAVGTGWWVVPVVIVTGYGTIDIGPFTSETAVQRWVDANFQAKELP
jgi:hypothetical protein